MTQSTCAAKAAHQSPTRAALVRVGVPEPNGTLVKTARDAGLPVLFSANAFMARNRDGIVTHIRPPHRALYGQLDAALDSAGFVACRQYRRYPWTIDQYLDLVESYSWSWYSTMDSSCEPELADDRVAIFFRIAETCRQFLRLSHRAMERGLPPPMPVLQGWTPAQYVYCADQYPLREWPALIGLGSMCRRNLAGPEGVLAVIDALDRVLPAHTRCHCFGVKGNALSVIGQHPRVASIDSMAWDYAARRDHPVGRSTALRATYMLDWASRNQTAAEAYQRQHTPSLFPVDPEQPDSRLAPWLDLVMEDACEGPQAMHHLWQLGGLEFASDETDETDEYA